MESRPVIFQMPSKPPGEPWESFPAFAAWADTKTPKDNPDGLRGVRTATALAGSLGLLSRAVVAALDPANDHQAVLTTINGELARVLHCATVLADEIGANPMRHWDGPAARYLANFQQAYGITEEVPPDQRGYFTQNIMLRASQHLLPLVLAVSVDHFTHDGLNKELAADEMIAGVNELHTLLSCYDIHISACLQWHVLAVNSTEGNDKNDC